MVKTTPLQASVTSRVPAPSTAKGAATAATSEHDRGAATSQPHPQKRQSTERRQPYIPEIYQGQEDSTEAHEHIQVINSIYFCHQFVTKF